MTSLDVGRFPAELVRLHQTALRVLIAQLGGDRGVCIACGTNWPCERAKLAAWTLEVM